MNETQRMRGCKREAYSMDIQFAIQAHKLRFFPTVLVGLVCLCGNEILRCGQEPKSLHSMAT